MPSLSHNAVVSVSKSLFQSHGTLRLWLKTDAVRKSCQNSYCCHGHIGCLSFPVRKIPIRDPCGLAWF